MASTMKEIPRKMRVLKIGAPKKDKKGKEIKYNFKVGDCLFFKKNFGFKWKEEGKEYIFLESEHITGVEVEE